MTGQPYQHPSIGMRGIFCALVGGVILGATSGYAFARSWGDSTEGRPLLQVFKASDFQTNATVQSVVQDHEGVLYFCSNGLLQYDGTTWRHYGADNNQGLRVGAIDEQGRIWVGGYGVIGYYEKDPFGQLYYTSLLAWLPPEHRDQLEVWGVEVTSRGVVFSAANKIMRWDGKTFHIWPLPDSRRVFSQKIGDAVYMTHQETGLWKLEGDQPVLVVPYDPSIKRVPYFLKPLGGDSFLAVTTSDLARITGSKMTLLPGNCGNFIRENFITAICVIDDHTFAIGTYRGGVVLVDDRGNIVRIIDRASGLPDQAVNGLFLDREKNLWITTERGIARMESSGTVTTFDEANHLTGRSVSSIAV